MHRRRAIVAGLAVVALVGSPASAVAQVSPGDVVPTILPTVSPTPSPTATPTTTPTPKPTPTQTPSGHHHKHHHHHHQGTHDGNHNNGSSSASHHNGSTPTHSGNSHKSRGTRDLTNKHSDKNRQGQDKQRKNKHHKNKSKKDKSKKGGYVNVEGGWNSDKLVNAATRLYAQGRSDQWVASHLFKPFPLEGPASFIDSWHFPRYGPAPGEVRKHEGEDIFCNFGEPVLAVQTGIVDFHDDGLGGHVAHVTKPDGTFWYYAHLSGWNTQEFADGDTVKAGDIIGYCGNSGDAAGGAPHLHFGYYQPSGKAMNPLSHLLHWLREAKQRAGIAVHVSTRLHRSTTDLRTMERRYGLSFNPAPIPTHGKVPSFLDPGDCSRAARDVRSAERAGADTACQIDAGSIESLLLD